MPGPALGELARRAEATGYHALVIPDHLIPQLSPVPAMAAIAAATTTPAHRHFVFNNDLRHPAVLAQDLASLDVLSDGPAGHRDRRRLEQARVRGDRPAVRSGRRPRRRLAEAVAVLKGCFAEGPFSFAGEHYTITDYDAGPKPVQRPHPPLLIGGGGRRILTLAGREAEIVGLAPRTWRAARRPAQHHVRGDGGEDRLGARGGRRAVRRRCELNVYPSAWPVDVTDDLHGEAAG